ncbi:Cytochrome P [Parasponia andersonii]|uniref:Cytochrome P n=1 Tax=Parasponia andersonii TaxID=3476 RepID=A0A2P5C7R7_PARAD|nr:Cytochrome P [Parasponia andersonii]
MGGLVAVILVLKRANEWYHIWMVAGRQCSLPPGDMGWPLIGNMWSFLIAFKFGDPDSFISNFIARFGRTGIYKAYLFGCPTIIVTTPETCRPVLMDDAQFKPGWPKSTSILMGRKSFLGLSAPISGLKAQSVYHELMKDVMLSSLDELAKADRPVEFLTEIRKITFKIIMYVFLSCEGGPIIKTMEEEYAKLNYGLRSMAINLPGFAYHKALNMVEGQERKGNNLSEEKKDMMDLLLDVEDENGEKLDDKEIIDVILMYLNAGHESTAHATLWATLFLHKHPEYLQRAKAEQEEILRTRPATEK